MNLIRRTGSPSGSGSGIVEKNISTNSSFQHMNIISPKGSSAVSLTFLRIVTDVSYATFVFYIGAFGLKRMTGGKPWTIRDIPFQKIDVNGQSTILLDFELNHELLPSNDVTFNDHWLWFCAFQLPLIIVLCLSRWRIDDTTYSRFYKSALVQNWDTLASFCGLIFAIGLSELVTNALKLYVGRLRPNFYSLCKFDIETLKCTAEMSDQYQSRKSFPSGHSSLSFTGLTFLVLYLIGRFGVCNLTEATTYSMHGRKGIILLCTAPWALALYIASSRSVDNWHHTSDIIAGSLLGIACAAISYHMW